MTDAQPNADECVRAGMYWFGRSDFEAARAWWDRALELSPGHARAQECLRLMERTTSTGFIEAQGSGTVPPSPGPNPSQTSPLEAWVPSASQARMSAVSSQLPAPSQSSPLEAWSSPAISSARGTGMTDTLVPLSSPEAVLPPPPLVRAPSTVSAPGGMVASQPDNAPLLDPAEGGSQLPPEAEVSQGWSNEDFVPSGDLASIDGPEDPDDPFAFAAGGQQMVSNSSLPPMQASPWDSGPSRTSIVTLGHDSGYDAVAEPTPLPTMDRERFFGRPDPQTKEEIEEYLRATGDLPPLPSELPSAPNTADLVVPAAPAPAASPMQLAQQRYQLHDFVGAMEWAEQVPADDPEHDQALELIVSSERELTRMYESKVGDFDYMPTVRVSSEELIWLNLNHRAGFILSQIDGTVSYEDLISLSGMARLDTLKILAQLIQEKVIA